MLGLDVGGQLGLELEHGAALLSLALEVRQLVQGLVGCIRWKWRLKKKLKI